MELTADFFITCVLLGIALAMDAFSVSVADGLNEPGMRGSKVVRVSGTFAIFQGAMPLIGWLIVRTAMELFDAIEPLIPWFAFILLTILGSRMVLDGLRDREHSLGLGTTALLAQGLATSIDALSVGFTITGYDVTGAAFCAAIIASITFGLCTLGLMAGKILGTRFAGRVTIFGGIILVIIGLDILIQDVFF